MIDRQTLGTAVSATLHCLAGCAIGEILGMLIGIELGWSELATTLLAVGLAFVSGYTLSTLPLVRRGMKFFPALRLVLVADTLSILVMEIVDNAVMLSIPGAMQQGLTDPLFWLSMAIALSVAFVVAWPVNYYLIRRGRGHALTHHHMHDHHDKGNHHHDRPAA